MQNLLFIGFQNEQKMQEGKISWKGEHLARIAAYTDITELNPLNTPRGIAYITGRDNLYTECYNLLIDEIIADEKSFTVYYEAGEKINYTTMTIISALRSALLNDEYGKLIPFCAAVEESAFNLVLEDEVIMKQLKKLASNNNWNEIVRQYGSPEQLESKPQYWNNPKVLEVIAFAYAKLSEVYINIKREFPDEKKRREYLENKKMLREQVIKLRNRIIELTPGNPGAYSNLGYSHYQFCRELVLQGGRRDGNLAEEAEQSLKYISKALELDPNRITDLYRKGQLLTRVIPDTMLFGGNGIISPEKINLVREKIAEGIKAFEKLETVYELIPEIDEKGLERYRKEYIKGLYDLSLAYESLIVADWNYTDYILSGNGSNGFIPEEDLTFIDKALHFIIKCIHKDNRENPNAVKNKETNQIASYIGEVEGVYKIYTLGKIYFRKYIILQKSGRAAEASEYGEKAFQLFKYAYKIPFSKEKSAQSKTFIPEKIARYFISGGKYDEAVKTLEKFIGYKHADYYVRYTYALAAMLNSMEDRAIEQLNLAVKSFNPEKYLGYLMIAIIENKMGNKRETFQALKNAIMTSGRKKEDKINDNEINLAVSEIEKGKTESGSARIKSQINIPAKRLTLIIRLINHTTGNQPTTNN